MASDTKVLSALVRNMKNRDVDPLSPLIDEYLLKRDKSKRRLRSYTIDMKSRRRPGGRFSPSSIGGCRRLAAYKFLGIQGTANIDPDLLWLFDDGDWRHHRFQATMYDMQKVLGKDRFKVLATEGTVTIPELFISGNADNKVKIEGRRYIIDWKGVNKWGFDDLGTKEEPKIEYVRQITTYEYGEDVPRGLLYFENKDNQRRKGWVVNFQQSVWAEIQEWVEETVEDLDNERLPLMHPDCHAGNYLYGVCPYAKLCYGRKHSDDDVRRKIYHGFEGVETAWENGLRAAAEDDSRPALPGL